MKKPRFGLLSRVVFAIQYCMAGAVSGKNPLKAMWKMLPAYMTALGTSSSAATRARLAVVLLALSVPSALCSAEWYSVRLLANPVVQPVGFAVGALEGPAPVVVRTGDGVARAYATDAVPSGSVALRSLEGVSRLDVDQSVRHVPAGVFENSGDLRVVSFEGFVRRIDSRAFAGSTNLSDVVLHEATSVLVASNAFSNCSSRLACVYPFSPMITAQDGSSQSGAPVFPRVLFLRGEALKQELSAH